MVVAVNKTIRTFRKLKDYLLINYAEGDVTVIHPSGSVTGTFFNVTRAIQPDAVVKFEISHLLGNGMAVLVMQVKQTEQETAADWVMGQFNSNFPLDNARSRVDDINALYAKLNGR